MLNGFGKFFLGSRTADRSSARSVHPCDGLSSERPRSARGHGYAEQESYIELEFTVGFGVEDEPWL